MIRILLFILLLTIGMALGVNAQEAADTGAAVGANELNLLNMIFNGNLGFSLGLVVVVLGLITMVRGSVSGGLTLIALGVLITLTPGVYNSMRTLFMPMVCSLWSLHCGS